MKNRLKGLFNLGFILPEESLEKVHDVSLLTPLHQAASTGDVNGIAHAYLEATVKTVDVLTPAGITPLLQAIFAGKKAVAYLLIGLGARLDLVDKWIRLHGASEDTYVLLSELGLLEAKRRAGVDIFRLRTEWGWNALDRAAQLGHLDLVELLLKRGLSPFDKDPEGGRTALHWAAAGGQGLVAKRLLEGAHSLSDLLIQDKLGHTASQVAMAAKNAAALAGRWEEAKRYQAVIEACHLAWERLYDKAAA